MDQVDQIREKTDIIALISEYIPLKQMGRNFKALCPFHLEKTPSFVVSKERQIWHCFGCAKGGDVFTFLMEYERLEFFEALRILAKRAGIEITTSFDKGVTSQKEIIYKLNRLALEFYHYLLVKHNVGKKALNYLLDKRKINPRVIETFSLGFSPSVGNVLSNYLLKKKGFSKKDMIDSGLSVERRGQVMDFFTNRLMFPLFDHHDNIIGFSGRILDEQSFMGSKYINTKETPAYHKGRVFFGLNIAKKQIKKEDFAIIVEGEFDVISLFEEGIDNVVAIKGTALTEEQVNLLSRFTQNVSLCFDQDSAGFEAAKRSLPILEKKRLSTTAIAIQNGKDPDEAIKKDANEFKKAIKNKVSIYDFFFKKAFSLFNKSDAIGKKNISDFLLPFLSLIENEIVKEHYLKKLSVELGVSYESVMRQLEKVGKSERKQIEQKAQEKKDRQELLEEYLLALIVQSKECFKLIQKASQILNDYEYKIISLQKLLMFLLSYSQKEKVFDSNIFAKNLPKELINAFDTVFLFPIPKNLDNLEYEKEIEIAAKELYSMYLRAKISKLGKKIKEREGQGGDGAQILNQELQNLLSLLQKSF